MDGIGFNILRITSINVKDTLEKSSPLKSPCRIRSQSGPLSGNITFAATSSAINPRLYKFIIVIIILMFLIKRKRQKKFNANNSKNSIEDDLRKKSK